MQIAFHDEYMLLAVGAVVVIVFCRPVADCFRALLSLCSVPRECGQLVFCARDLLRNAILAYCLFQPVWFWAASRAGALDSNLRNSTPACVKSVDIYFNQTALAVDVIEVDRAVSSVATVDALVVLMPFAVISAIATAAWKHLCDMSVLNADDAWDCELFVEDSKVWEYEMLHVLEMFLMAFGTIYASSGGVSLEMAVYASVTLTAFQIFFATAARHSNKAPAASCIMSTLTVVFVLVILHLGLRLVDRQSLARTVCGVAGLTAQFVLGAAHQVAAGESSVGSILLLRVSVSLATSVSFVVILALRVCGS